MDAKDPGYSESRERKSRLFPGGRERGTVPGSCSSHCERRTRNREPHLLSPEPGALLAGAHPAGVERNPALARNDNRSRDHIIPPAVRGGYRPDAAERAGSAENCGRPQLSRGPGEYRPTRLGKARDGYHPAARETATARWQRDLAA